MKAKFIPRPLFIRLFTLLLCTIAAPAAAGDNLVLRADSGWIDWSAGMVRASGVGVPTTTGNGQSPEDAAGILDRARRSAQINLLKTVKTIRIDAETRVADRMARDDTFREGLHTLVSNAAITRQEYLSDGTLEIELTMNLTGGFGQFVLPEEIRQVEPVTTMTPVQADDLPPGEKDDTADRPYTGVIIDATGIGAQPALVPVVVDESEEVVYGSAYVSREFAVSRGMSSFAATLDAARNDPRVGSHPMIVKAVRTRSGGAADLVISTADAARLRSSAVHLDFLKACRVSIVIDLAENVAE